nr:tRNA (guanosine(46)-N7)-methyltransferase TrmB [Micromonospora sp. Llam0]
MTARTRSVSDIGCRHVSIRTYHPRRGRLSGRHHDALDRLSGAYRTVVAELPAPLDPAALFGRTAPVVLDIGFGMGDATATMAAADRDRDYLAVEVHTPGIANLLALIEQHALTNVRVATGDALDLARRCLPERSLDAVYAFFPDPWPKARHHKRRLVRPEHVALLRSRLRPGGRLHCATDWAPYAEAMLATLTADPQLRNLHDGYAPRPAYRPETKFERRGVRAGRPALDLVFERVGGTPDG